MNAGYASRDITPEPGITLSGFAARCHRPSAGIDDPISVHALALEQDGQRVLLLVFDLLALGPEITEKIHKALDASPEIYTPCSQRIFCCTHTHSAPATITLLGCGIPVPAYWDRLAQLATEAAVEACNGLQRATLQLTTIPLPGANYNRRALLDDGRVVMTQYPTSPVVKRGPTWETMVLLRFADEQGEPIAGIAHWAAHPATVCGMNISADFPGELCWRLMGKFHTPFLFLQGACGNVSPPFLQMTRDEMLQNIEKIMVMMDDAEAATSTFSTTPFDLITATLPLKYQQLPKQAELQRFHQEMAEIAATGNGSKKMLAVLSNILNVEPGAQADPEMMRYIAGCMQEWSQRTLSQSHHGVTATTCDLPLTVLRLGTLAISFIAAETFVETAIDLQKSFPDLSVVTVGYASPLVGYLPTAEAMSEGGYEVDHAYRFYAHPAPFVPESEAAVRTILEEMIAATSTNHLSD